MAKNFFKRYIWLVDLINRRKYVSFKEINEAWMRSPLNETGDPLSERTFFNHKDAIAGMFGIEILNDRSLGFYIGRSDVGSDETSDWMLHTLCLNNVLHENADMKDRILMEKVPSSERFLTDIISAMRDFRVISLCYQSFRHPEPFCFNVRPYCVKYFKQRWYLLGDSDLGCGYIHWTASWTWKSWRNILRFRRVSTRRNISGTTSVSSSGRSRRT